MTAWYHLTNPEEVSSPALLVYPDRVGRNIQEMIRVAGNVERLRPHVKTHKCREIVALQQASGIEKFKCATIAEAEMLAECQVKDILLAYQPIGPNAVRYLELLNKYDDANFSALVDNIGTAEQLTQLAFASGVTLNLFIDLDVGMHRTGIKAGAGALDLMQYVKQSDSLEFRGWHAYDGHIVNTDLEERKQAVADSFKSVSDLVLGDGNIEVVAGGSPTFPIHALNPAVDLSPGTTLLWDQGYSQKLPDQKFLHAVVLITRVISKPEEDLLCLDLGNKAVASEMPHPRVRFPDLGQVEFITHSEEHLVIRTSQAADHQVGDVLYGIPMHVCPTVALHQELVVIENGKAVDRWRVYARDRRVNV